MICLAPGDEGCPHIVHTQQGLLAARATLADSLRTSDSGNQIVTLPDPWGLALQFVQRKIPMLPRTGRHLEHVAIIVTRAGATVVEMHKTSQGDADVLPRDPWGVPVHVLKRVNSMLT